MSIIISILLVLVVAILVTKFYPKQKHLPIPEVTFKVYKVTNCCDSNISGHITIPGDNIIPGTVVVSKTDNQCYSINYEENETPNLEWDGNIYGAHGCGNCLSAYPCKEEPIKIIKEVIKETTEIPSTIESIQAPKKRKYNKKKSSKKMNANKAI